METFWPIVMFIGIVLLTLLPKLGPPVGPVHPSGIRVRFSNDPISKSISDTERQQSKA